MSLRVAYFPGDHDYLRALYGAISSLYSPEARVVVGSPCRERQGLDDLVGSWSAADIVHIGWPEHLLADPSPGCASHARRTLEALEWLERLGVLVAWTMHNSRPHSWPAAEGSLLYARMATLAHAVIHHSECGMREMTRTLPYQNSAIHAVIPHGHYASELALAKDRSECERLLGLDPCTLRFGVLGRPQAEKRVAEIARAFLERAGKDRQLLVSAIGLDETLPADSRLACRPRSRWLAREEIAVQLKCCDCLVAWHGGGSHLTSGLVADAIGAGIPMLVNADWQYWHEALGTAALSFQGRDSLAKAFETVTPAEIARGGIAAKALRPTCDWTHSAQETVGLFARVGAFRARRRSPKDVHP